MLPSSSARTSAYRSGPIQDRAISIDSSTTALPKSIKPERFALASEETGNRHACRLGNPTPAPLVHKQEISSPLNCKRDCLGFANIQVLANFLHTGLVSRARDD